ncbi:MAG: hypothetical protein WBE44_01090 [Terriglobales bacterium]|jgi:hypothetical protein
MRSPILLLHIIAGTLGMLSGFIAVFLRKGSRQHGLAGKVFVIAMLSLSASGVYLAILKSQPGNILGGTLTFYLVATAWMTGRRRDNAEPGVFDWGALLIVSAVVVSQMTFGLEAAFSQTGLKYGYPSWPYFFMGSVAVLAFTGDVRMLVRNGVSGAQRIARHLWRMCFALFIAASSIFLARQQLFPAIFRKTGALAFLSFLPLLLMIFWLLRVRFTNAFKRKAIAHAAPLIQSPVESRVRRISIGRPAGTAARV